LIVRQLRAVRRGQLCATTRRRARTRRDVLDVVELADVADDLDDEVAVHERAEREAGEDRVLDALVRRLDDAEAGVEGAKS